MTIEEKAWEIIKGMHISGPWQEHIVHQAIMKMMESQWNDIDEVKPEDGQRVLTWNDRFKEVRIQVFNGYYQCWDAEDGDDCEYGLDEGIIKYWMPLPKKPQV